MIVVIQCAATKRPDAGTLSTDSGKKVIFVADPALAPVVDGQIFARPDDQFSEDQSWRDKLLDYNRAGTNPNRLLRAYELYENGIYREFVRRFGIENTFILSAGWGLIRADFLTPLYDITFSSAIRASAPYKFRHKRDSYRDLCQVPKVSNPPIFFFGGKDYVPLFAALTGGLEGRRTVFYNSATPPVAPGCVLETFETAARTNWHYECAKWFLRKGTA